MRYLIWGTGSYCQEKIGYINSDDIVAFIERTKGKGDFRGKKIILPEEIERYEYDFIIVFSNHYAEIILEMVEMGIDYKKIIPGINCRPFLVSELEYISSKGRVIVTDDGKLEYVFREKTYLKIENEESWNQIRRLMCSEKNASAIKAMDTNPVGKKYGVDRGGSICRYYLDEFLSEYRNVIKGRVLEIGDRNYTKKYGENVQESYVLHFDEVDKESKLDFTGDLRNGEGIEKSFYDCIILTQVLNFIEDIKETPDILINALKPGGKLLVSVAGISAICRYDMDKYGQYWNFTDKSIKNMFTRNDTECKVWTKGNCKVACTFLQGMGCVELTKQELDDTDEDFQVVIFSVVTRKVYE